MVPAVFAGGDDRPLRDAVLRAATSGLADRALGGDDDRGDRPARRSATARTSALLEQVRTDPLTGLGSRGAHAGRPRRRLRDGDRGASRSSLLLFDLNGFKRYNDTFGHPAGDELLAELGGRLNAARRRGRHRLPDRRRRVLRAARLRRERFDAVARARRRGADRERNGVDVSASWGAVDDPGRGRRPRRGDAARRRAHVRAEGVAARRPPRRPDRLRRARCEPVRRDRRKLVEQRSVGPSSPRPARPGPRRGRPASPPRRARPSARGRAAAPAAAIAPASIAACRLASIRPRPCSAPISRQRSQPSTEGRRGGRSAQLASRCSS